MPAVIHVVGKGKGARSLGHGRSQRMRRRGYCARRQRLQRVGKVRAVRKRQGNERRWRRDRNHKLSRQIVSQAQAQDVGTIRLERRAGIRQRTARTSRRAKKSNARKNNRVLATWPFSQLSTFVTYTAERMGMRGEPVDPAYTSQTCPACCARNQAQDCRSVCGACGWTVHRDQVGAITNSRRAGLTGHRQGGAKM
jgi:IS605 OrfB family transposase